MGAHATKTAPQEALWGRFRGELVPYRVEVDLHSVSQRCHRVPLGFSTPTARASDADDSQWPAEPR